MNFTYLQHPCISSFHGKIHLLLTTDFYTQVHEMSLVPRKKTSHGNVTFSRILCSTHFHSIVQEMSLVPRKKTSHGNVMFSRILCSRLHLYHLVRFHGNLYHRFSFRSPSLESSHNTSHDHRELKNKISNLTITMSTYLKITWMFACWHHMNLKTYLFLKAT
jgi:hypothetical protein